LRNLQDALGEVHDFDVLWAKIRAHSELAAQDRLRWQRRIAAERQKRLDFYRGKMLGSNSLWRLWRRELPDGEELERAAMEKLKIWAAFLDPDFSHAIVVTKLALQIYDALDQGALTNKMADRRLLEAASMLHEVGRSKGDRQHHKRSYKMIRKLSTPVGWSQEDMRAVAIIARYHRGALAPASNAVFAGLNTKRRSELLTLAGVLRLANAFDLTHDGHIASVTVENRESKLVISVPGFEEISPSAERIARRRYLLEASCGVPIAIRPLGHRRSTVAVRRLALRSARASAG
jgi:HD superfamily phosphodiesterase